MRTTEQIINSLVSYSDMAALSGFSEKQVWEELPELVPDYKEIPQSETFVKICMTLCANAFDLSGTEAWVLADKAYKAYVASFKSLVLLMNH